MAWNWQKVENKKKIFQKTKVPVQYKLVMANYFLFFFCFVFDQSKVSQSGWWSKVAKKCYRNFLFGCFPKNKNKNSKDDLSNNKTSQFYVETQTHRLSIMHTHYTPFPFLTLIYRTANRSIDWWIQSSCNYRANGLHKKKTKRM